MIFEKFKCSRRGQICEFINLAIILIRNHGKTINERTRGLLVSVKTQYLTWPMVELDLFTPIYLQPLHAATMFVQHFHDF